MAERADDAGRRLAVVARVAPQISLATQQSAKTGTIKQSTMPQEALIYSASGMKCKEPGAQEARHIMRIGELSSTARRSNSPAQPINQRFPNAGPS